MTGIRIVELAGIGPGPFCGMLLADFGAEVISVERRPPPDADPDLTDNGVLRRGRRSIAIDLKAPGGAELVLDLVERSDAIFEGMRPGAAERLGVGPDECLARNPRIVYGRMTGWGQTGPLARHVGHDLNYISVAGALHTIGDQAPTPPLNLVADFGGGGMLLALGMLAALMHASESGEGQVVDAAMIDGVGLLMAMCWDFFDQGRWTDRRRDNVLDGGAPFSDVYRCADDRWLAVAPIEPRFRERLLELLEIPFEPEDLGLERDVWPGLREKLEARFRERPRDEWVDLLGDEETCVTPVLSLAEARDHHHALSRDAFLPGPREGARQPAPAPRFSATPAPAPADPPAIGADADAILTELGIDPRRVAELRAAGALT